MIQKMLMSSGGGGVQNVYCKANVTWSGNSNLSVSGLPFEPKAIDVRIQGGYYMTNKINGVFSDSQIAVYNSSGVYQNTQSLTISSDGFTVAYSWSSSAYTVDIAVAN
jgi:hypothetical protein